VTEVEVHHWATWAEIVAAIFTVLALTFITAPYGRHARGGWGPTVSNTVGWILMELPAVVLFCAIYSLGDKWSERAPLALLAMWQFHYIHRTFIFPFRLKTTGKRMAVSIVGIAVIFNSLNAYVNARWLSHFGDYPSDWLTSPAFILGALVFALGFYINFKADHILINLRKPGETGYKMPKGWLYDYVTCPNYLGEILEWTGFAIASWSLPGLAFALYTAANVGPRAFQNRRWYREKFKDYPPKRKALIPFVI